MGLGFPFFKFYAALPYYLAAGMSLLGVELTTAIKLTQDCWDDRGRAGHAAVGARVAAPRPPRRWRARPTPWRRFTWSTCMCGATRCPEFYAFVWYPLILWAAGRLIERVTRGRVVGLALPLAALVLTHNVSALIFAPFIALWALAGLARPAVDRRAAVAGLVSAALLALGLSAGLWLPALGEAGSVQLGDQTTGYFNYANHFRGLDLVQASAMVDYHPEGAKFALGLLQAALALLARGRLADPRRAARAGLGWAGAGVAGFERADDHAAFGAGLGRVEAVAAGAVPLAVFIGGLVVYRAVRGRGC